MGQVTMSTLRKRLPVILTLVFVQLCYGLHYIAARVVIAEIPPRGWAVLRAAGGALILSLICLVVRRSLRVAPRDLGRLAILAIFGVVLNQVLFIEGLSRTSTSHSSLINASIPMMTLLLAVALGRERVTSGKLAALSIATLGVILVIVSGESFSGQTTGDLLTLMNATSFSLFLVLSKRLLQRIDPLTASTILMIFGAIGIGFVGGPTLVEALPLTVSGSTWLLAAFIMIFPTAAVYVLGYWALARIESSSVALFIYLQPIIASTLAIFLFGETLGWRVIVGGLLIFGGIFLTFRNKRTDQGANASRINSSAPSGSAASSISNCDE